MDELGLSNRVLFKGFVNDEEIPSFYNRADLFVFPSIYEGFGIPALEAMACGCPVIASKSGCSPEVVGDAAVLVDPHDPGMLAAAMRDVIEDGGLRRQLIDAGLKRVKKFSWRRCAAQTLALFGSLNQ